MSPSYATPRATSAQHPPKNTAQLPPFLGKNTLAVARVPRMLRGKRLGTCSRNILLVFAQHLAQLLRNILRKIPGLFTGLVRVLVQRNF